MEAGMHTLLPAPPENPPGEARKYLIFTLSGESFAIDIVRVREITEYGSVTEVPMMPGAVRGVINLRGAVVPVIDLVARFGRGRTRAGRRTCIVILEVELEGDDAVQVMGIVVDAVNEVLEIPGADIAPPPSFGTGLRSDFIAGMGRVGERFVVILDLPRVLSLGDAMQTESARG